MNFDVDYIRKQFPSLAVEVDGSPAVYLDDLRLRCQDYLRQF